MRRTTKRLEDIEVQLSPKQWAIRLVGEIRDYPSILEFHRAMAKGQFRDNPYRKPFLALKEQAGRKFPGRKERDILNRSELSDRLLGGYQAFKTLIDIANEDAESKSKAARLVA